ncbi:MAG: hypothetical protein ABI629_07890 [bacterium]
MRFAMGRRAYHAAVSPFNGRDSGAGRQTHLANTQKDGVSGGVTMFLQAEESAERLFTRVKCSRCRYAQEKPGRPLPGDLDRMCALCGAPLSSVTTFCVAERR